MTATYSGETSAWEPARVPSAPARPIRLGLAGLDDRELLSIVRSLPRASERRAVVALPAEMPGVFHAENG